jgi:hypothetical protein
MTKGVSLTVGTLVVLCLALAWLARRENIEIQSLRAASDGRVSAEKGDRSEIRRLQRELALYERDPDPKEPNALPPAEGAPPRASRQVDLMPYFQKDPKFEELHRKRMLQQVRNMYGTLKSLNLDNDQQEKLTVLLANKINAPIDARESALAQGITDGSPEMSRAFRDTMKSADDEIKALVGDSGFQDLNALSRQISSRNLVNASLGREFIAGGQPLTADQVNALADVHGHPQGSQDEMEQAMRDRAAQILSPSQLEIFLQNREIERESRDLEQRATDAATKETGSTSFRSGPW